MSASSSTTRTRPVSSADTCGILRSLPHSALWRRTMEQSSYLELLDWRRRTAELFAALRARTPDAETLAWFRAEKDALFRDHPQSPLPLTERDTFGGLPYW